MYLKLEKLGDFNSGINPSRLTFEERVIYSQSMFDSDLEQKPDACNFYVGEEMETYKVKTDDILIRSASAKAAIVSKEHNGTIYTANYIKADLYPDLVYYKYFVYVFNCNKEVAKQLANSIQGTVIARVTTSVLKKIEIPIPPLATQKKIGDLYFETLNLKRLYNLKAEQIKMMTETYLEQVIKDMEVQ